jgi:hypothetical protein
MIYAIPGNNNNNNNNSAVDESNSKINNSDVSPQPSS